MSFGSSLALPRPARRLLLWTVLTGAVLPAQSPSEFLGPAGGTAGASADPVARQDVPELGSVLAAGTTVGAADAAAVQLREVRDGIRLIRVGSGLGVVAGSTASYRNDHSDLRFALLAQRSAVLRATMAARVGLLNYFKGLSLSGRTTLQESLATLDGADSRSAGYDLRQSESLESQSRGLLRGAIVYSLEDDPAKGEVFVSLIVTPKTLANQAGAAGGRVAVVPDLARAMEWLTGEVSRGTVPPEGGRILTVPGTGQVVWVGFGTGIAVSASSDEFLARKVREAAEKQARRRAEFALLRVMKGEEVSATDSLSEEFAEAAKSFEDLAKGTATSEASVASAMNSAELQQVRVSGNLPPGVTTQVFLSQSGHWVYAVSCYPPFQQAASGEPAAAPAPAAPGAPAPAPAPGVAAPSAADATCTSEPENGINRAEAAGQGQSRRSALKQALLEGVEKCNGLSLKGSSVVKEIYRDAVKDLNGKIDRVVEAESVNKEEIFTESNGMISGYRILSEGQDAQGTWTVRACVEVPIFDPNRPRPGRRPSVAVLPFTASKARFEVHGHPGGLDASQVINEFVTGLSSQFAATGEFTVIERQHMGALDAELDRLRQGIAKGAIDLQEQVKFGREIGVDFVVVGTIDNLEHRFTEVFNRVRNAKEPRESLLIKVNASLVNVATKGIVASHAFEQVWDFMQLVRLDPANASLSRETYACRQALGAFSGEFVPALVKLKASSTPRILERLSAQEAVLEYAGPQLADGTELFVYGMRQKQSSASGQVRKIQVRKGKVRVKRTDLDQGLVYCDIVEEAETFREGDECRRR